MPSVDYSKITTIIFDVDDTLYDVGTGFTKHRTGEAAHQFMVERLGFSSLEEARLLRDEYFKRYHSTSKALIVAEQEGKFPPMEGAPTPRFRAQDLAEYWASNLDFSLLKGPHTTLQQDLNECPLKLVAFSNGPRKYVERVLVELGVRETFRDDRLFAVDDVLPYCKPEREAFDVIFKKIGVMDPAECVMVEDSMKNVRKAKELGMTTVLVTGSTSVDGLDADAARRGAAVDVPDEKDPAVDIAISTIEELRSRVPQLWKPI